MQHLIRPSTLSFATPSPVSGCYFKQVVLGTWLHAERRGCMQKDINDEPWETFNQTHQANSCKALALVSIPAEYLHTPNAYQDTCILLALVRIPAYPPPDAGQVTCILLGLVKIPPFPRRWSGYLHTPGTCQDTRRVPAYP